MKRRILILSAICFCCCWLTACAGSQGGNSNALDVPLDMPEMCHDIDFNLNVEMRDLCGVKVRSYRSYKNIPQYRILLVPKNGKIVMKGNKYELRLPKMLPAELPHELSGKLNFNETARRQYVKSTWDYQEFFPRNSTEIVKIMRIEIPLDKGEGSESACYTVVRPPKSAAKIDRGYASQLETLDCERFEKLKLQAE